METTPAKEVPGKLKDLPENLRARITADSIHLSVEVGLVSYHKVTLADVHAEDNKEYWTNDLNIEGKYYFLHVSIDKLEQVNASIMDWNWEQEEDDKAPRRYITGDAHVLRVVVDASVPKNVGKPVERKIPETTTPQEVVNITNTDVVVAQAEAAAPPVEEYAPMSTTEKEDTLNNMNAAPAIPPTRHVPKAAPQPGDPDWVTPILAEDIPPQPTKEYSQEVKDLAKATTPSLAKKLSLAPELSEEQRQLWVDVSGYLDSIKEECKYYSVIVASGLKGKVLSDDVIMEICNLIEKES